MEFRCLIIIPFNIDVSLMLSPATPTEIEDSPISYIISISPIQSLEYPNNFEQL